MSQTVTRTIRLSPADNVVVARAALRADTRVEEEALTTLDPIDPGHKVATQAISKGDTIRKYDQSCFRPQQAAPAARARFLRDAPSHKTYVKKTRT